MSPSKRDAHPATVAQTKAPHPAKVVQAKAPHPANGVQAKASPAATEGMAKTPHPATVAQAKAPARGRSVLPPHPATVVQRRAAPGADGGTAQPMLERIRRGFGYTAGSIGGVGGGVLTGVGYGLMATNPIGWIMGGLAAGTMLGAGAAYYLGSGEEEDDDEGEPVKDEQRTGEQPKGPSKDAQWKELQSARKTYEEELEKLGKSLRLIHRSMVDMRTLCRKMMARQPMLQAISKATSTELDAWRGELERATLRDAARKGKVAIEKFTAFHGQYEDIASRRPIEHVTQKNFKKFGGLTWRKQAMVDDLKDWTAKVKELDDAGSKVDTILTERDAEEFRIVRAARSWGNAPPEAAVEPPRALNRGGERYLDDTYPDGYVYIAGNAYAAITDAGARLLDVDALRMFQDALANGSIADYGTGASGVKWGKRELKVRRTRLEAIAWPGDSRLTGDIVTVPSHTSGLAGDIRVLEFSKLIRAH